ncbi:amidase [Acetobacteraceae bacterium KSS8]|uniref:Amidase n=1 Tax=Endosaccharibacter trunci TaxID=2812733 RepID=A0ABT1W6G7_9PROT|nr:amidase [Acetobacteraceae bacterium KSS8]
MAAETAPIETLSAGALLDGIGAGRLTAERVVTHLLARIGEIDPKIRSVLAVAPDAVEQARGSDRYRASHPPRPLEGVPVLVKDNIEVAGTLPTTAGSLALLNNRTNRDAPIVARLRAAGAVILGKTNLSEWANMRGERSVSGWSALGGQTRNPYALDRSPSGSSSGSAASVAALLAPLAIGTETDGSITMPASVCGLVGLKPTVGLLSRSRIVPISASQDTPGPIARSVTDAARMLDAMAGSDPHDPATAEADRRRTDYAAALAEGVTFSGKRLGVLRFLAGRHPGTDALFDATLKRLSDAGAELVDIDSVDGMDRINQGELLVLLSELKTGLGAYLADSPIRDQPQTLAELIRFNRAHAARELEIFGQQLFEQAEATKGLQDPAYVAARAESLRLARAAIEGPVARFRLDALVAPTAGPAGLIDPVDGDIDTGSASTLPAVAGAPHLTVPMGMVSDLPVGLSFIGPRWSETLLLQLGHAFEAMRPALAGPTFPHDIALPAHWDRPLPGF